MLEEISLFTNIMKIQTSHQAEDENRFVSFKWKISRNENCLKAAA